ncbi:efflux RND transporter periplasmic adaptor subunit [Metapseudomonas otitidis]|uniref:efflux RND transporter periplasmic adaptor subunit n=1 Tax=Metapseudomonas otitidis TaxID=319939 RepID=UPI0039FCC626
MKPWLPALALAALAGCSQETDEAPAPRPVLYVTVRSDDVHQVGRFAGSIQARYETTLGFRTNGRIAARTLNVGDSVETGTLLATLDPTDQQNALLSAQGDASRAEAEWIDAQADERRQAELLARGVGAQANLDRARTRLKTSRATLEQANSAVRRAQDQLGYTELRSDIAGVITQWHAEAGQVVQAGQEVVTLVRPDVKEAVVDLPDELVQRLPADARFEVSAQLDPQARTTGTVRELAPQADATTRTRRLRLSLDEAPPSFHLGSTVSVLLSSPVAPRTHLPATALIGDTRATGPAQVWVLDPQARQVHRRTVEVLHNQDGKVTVGSGLADGERVVSAGVNSLKEGQEVKMDEGAQP